MYETEPSYKLKLIIGFITLVLGIAGILTESNIPVSIFLIVISLLMFLVVLTDYIKELKKKKSE